LQLETLYQEESNSLTLTITGQFGNDFSFSRTEVWKLISGEDGKLN
jgi:hypothetical protein